MPISIQEVGSNRRHRSKALLHWVARSGSLLTLALTIALPASAIDLSHADKPLKEKIEADIKVCAKGSKIKQYEIKTGWEQGKLTKPTTFVRLSNTEPKNVLNKGFHPKDNIEAVFKSDKDAQYTIFNINEEKTCVFVFAYKSPISKTDKLTKNVLDKKIFPKALSQLGWGKSKYLYEFELPSGTYYASHNKMVNDRSEIAFPKPITAKEIRRAYKLDGGQYKEVVLKR